MYRVRKLFHVNRLPLLLTTLLPKKKKKKKKEKKREKKKIFSSRKKYMGSNSSTVNASKTQIFWNTKSKLYLNLYALPLYHRINIAISISVSHRDKYPPPYL
jgi:hypothetical protein